MWLVPPPFDPRLVVAVRVTLRILTTAALVAPTLYDARIGAVIVAALAWRTLWRSD